MDKNGEIIGEGYNAPPLNDVNQRKCNCKFDLSIKPKYDKTYCIHAKWNAIINALKMNGSRIDCETLYFMRVDENGNWEPSAGKPFCTVCSRLALQSGLANFALWVDNKPKIYTTSDYNDESYKYYKSNTIEDKRPKID